MTGSTILDAIDQTLGVFHPHPHGKRLAFQRHTALLPQFVSIPSTVAGGQDRGRAAHRGGRALYPGRRTAAREGTARSSRRQLIAWLSATTTGMHLLRAGIPPAWRVGDKTGRGPRFETNDVAIVWPPGREPLLMAAAR